MDERGGHRRHIVESIAGNPVLAQSAFVGHPRFEHHLRPTGGTTIRRHFPGRLFRRKVRGSSSSHRRGIPAWTTARFPPCRQFVYHSFAVLTAQVLKDSRPMLDKSSAINAYRCEYEVIWHMSRRTVRRCGLATGCYEDREIAIAPRPATATMPSGYYVVGPPELELRRGRSSVRPVAGSSRPGVGRHALRMEHRRGDGLHGRILSIDPLSVGRHSGSFTILDADRQIRYSTFSP